MVDDCDNRKNLINCCHREFFQSGQALAEYIIIVIVVAVCVLVGIEFFGDSVGGRFDDAVQKVASLGGDTPSSHKGVLNNDAGGGSRSVSLKGHDTEFLDSYDDSSDGGATSSFSGTESDASDARAAKVARLQRARISGQSSYEDVELDWDMLILFAVFVCAFGSYLVVRYGRSATKQFEKTDDGEADDAPVEQ